MAREKDPKQEVALELLRKGDKTNREIAIELGIDERKVSNWKSRYITKANGVQQSKERCTTKKDVVVKEKLKPKEIEVIYDSGLPEKQRLFCLYYIQSFNGTQSAIKAGYAISGAFVEANRLLKNAKVKQYLSELKQQMSNDDYLDAKRLIERHGKIAFSDTKDYMDEEGNFILDKVDGTLIKKVSVKKKSTQFGEEVSTSIELEDRSKSLDFLSKFHGLDPSFTIATKKHELELEKLNTATKEKIEKWILSLDEERLNKLLELIDNEQT